MHFIAMSSQAVKSNFLGVVELDVMLNPSEHGNVSDLLSGQLHAHDLFQRLILIQLAKQFPAFYGSGRFIIVLKNSAIGPYEEPVEAIPHLHISFF
jgi:hypothetical protein